MRIAARTHSTKTPWSWNFMYLISSIPVSQQHKIRDAGTLLYRMLMMNCPLLSTILLYAYLFLLVSCYSSIGNYSPSIALETLQRSSLSLWYLYLLPHIQPSVLFYIILFCFTSIYPNLTSMADASSFYIAFIKKAVGDFCTYDSCMGELAQTHFIIFG